MKILEMKNNEKYEITDEEGVAVLKGMTSKDTVLLSRLELAFDPKMVSLVYTPGDLLGIRVYVEKQFCSKYFIRKVDENIYSLHVHSTRNQSILQGDLATLEAHLAKIDAVPIDEHMVQKTKGNNTLNIQSSKKLQLGDGSL